MLFQYLHELVTIDIVSIGSEHVILLSLELS